MSITREESELLGKLSDLTADESDSVSEAMREVGKIMRLYRLKPAQDDRAARLEAAMIRYVLDSRK